MKKSLYSLIKELQDKKISFKYSGSDVTGNHCISINRKYYNDFDDVYNNCNIHISEYNVEFQFKNTKFPISLYERVFKYRIGR